VPHLDLPDSTNPAGDGNLIGQIGFAACLVARWQSYGCRSVCPSQGILPTIVAMSAAEKARNDSVRTLPSAARLKLSDMADDSSGASTIVTVSYRPCVQKIILHSNSKRLRHLLEGVCPLREILGVADSLIGELRKHDICYPGNPPSLGPCATWHEKAVLRLPQQLQHRFISLFAKQSSVCRSCHQSETVQTAETHVGVARAVCPKQTKRSGISLWRRWLRNLAKKPHCCGCRAQ
jgi:hypothetical protein